MEREPHENVATVLVDPLVLPQLEVHLLSLDLRLWPIATAPICSDGPRRAFQTRRRLLMAKRGAWDDAAEWTPVWIAFGESWYDGRPALILDYSRTSRLYSPYRDEIRQVGPGLYLGRMYERTAPQPTLTTYFALEDR